MLQRWLSSLWAKYGDDWTKPLGGVLATITFLWGTWIFLFQEVLRPAVAPVNISLELEIKRLKPLQEAIGKAQPVLLKVSAKNSSKKILFIRKTYWVAYGIKLASSRTLNGKVVPPHTEAELIDDINSQMTQGRENLSLDDTATSLYQRSDDTWDLIGFGPLFDISDIRPEEEIKAQRVVLVPNLAPADQYQLLRVRVIIPSHAKRSNLADDDLIRVVGGVTSPSKDFISVGFCQAERSWNRHGLHWFFDKFSLPQDRLENPTFQGPATRYCPTLMTKEQKEKVGAQVFASTFEIPMDVDPEAVK